jgi:oligopeptide transport system ATP-binding protein
VTITEIDESGATPPGAMDAPLLDVDSLEVEFRTREGVAKAVDRVSFQVRQGETLAILGESGCGKSVTAQAIMGILDTPPGFVTGGSVRFRGTDLLALPEDERRKYRGAKIAMIFQDALSALNPVHSVGRQLGEMFVEHRGMSRKDAKVKAIELMDMVRIPAATQRVNDYPHQFSGGMRQRIMIAMALSLDPEVVIADEPTTALDVTVQAQIMELLAEQQAEREMGLILITHDLGVVADVADSITVMYAGRVAEQAPIAELYAKPLHPYTLGLLESIPRVDLKGEELYAIKGLPPNLTRIPPGCSFAPRCRFAQDICRADPPPEHRQIQPGRWAACHFSELLLDEETTDGE